MPSSCPANISNPVEYDSSIGYVISTPNSNPTAMIGIILAPTKKQHRVTSQLLPLINENDVAIMLKKDRADITMTESLYVFLISTHIPNAAEPTNPPMIKTAPNVEASSVPNPYLFAICPTTVPNVLNTPWMNPKMIISSITILFVNSSFMLG